MSQWVEYKDAQGQPYYFNMLTNVTSWNKPVTATGASAVPTTWECEASPKNWIAYTTDLLPQFDQAYNKFVATGVDEQFSFDARGHSYVINFGTMVQKNVHIGTTRPIRIVGGNQPPQVVMSTKTWECEASPKNW
eukprot:CAMPEP_0114387990 /NCGR_PEP_ID=MMETSP0102-20121206/7635_1 /TAXON_ID=38822 ORGANISM="Pteridomonas danica, Strain PT" /NCGR_SAMPLE_ID=MMETSP0102 /ASSEMBLY_ACC=CAM_ASM_000212 /LENGTH=134 /DNA_ID=CAMNT_0001545291 /DNA_START=16 /DNA_END=417 /DNA_ORIENTATION=+